MSTGRRIMNVILGILMIALGVVLMLYPEIGFSVIMGIFGLALVIYGIRTLIYYFSMARHMVGGKAMLYIGIIALDIGTFTTALTDVPRIYMVLYLLAIHLFAGAVDLLRCREAKAAGASYHLTTLTGLVNVVIAVLCIVFLRSTEMLVYIYCAGLFVSACTRIISAFRRTAVVYIP